MRVIDTGFLDNRIMPQSWWVKRGEIFAEVKARLISSYGVSAASKEIVSTVTVGTIDDVLADPRRDDFSRDFVWALLRIRKWDHWDDPVRMFMHKMDITDVMDALYYDDVMYLWSDLEYFLFRREMEGKRAGEIRNEMILRR